MMTDKKGRARRHVPKPRPKKIEPVTSDEIADAYLGANRIDPKDPKDRGRIDPYVTKTMRNGMPKVVRDPKLGYDIEVVQAQARRTCGAGMHCKVDPEFATIETGDAYLKIIDLNAPGTSSAYGGRIPSSTDRHSDCGPAQLNEALVLFLPQREQLRIKALMALQSGLGKTMADLTKPAKAGPFLGDDDDLI